jgi:hypothetical protein
MTRLDMKPLSPQQRAALALLSGYAATDQLGYWAWRAQIRPFRQITHRLEDEGLIQIMLIRLTHTATHASFLSSGDTAL